MKVEGGKELAAILRRFADGSARKAVARVVYQKAEIIAGKAKDEYVPVDLGALKGSIRADGPHDADGKVSASVVAGGPAAPYAVVVHEDLTAHHDVGGPKYLERPAMEVRPTIRPAILEALRRERRKGRK